LLKNFGVFGFSPTPSAATVESFEIELTIDVPVHDLCGLTEEEIQLVEGGQ
jgi:hypothetical protein